MNSAKRLEVSLQEPNFLIIGAAKAATTTLASLLMQHPQAGVVPIKEPHYFSMRHAMWSWEQYLSLFQPCVGKLAIGDASTSYSRLRYHPGVVERIRSRLPDVKIIYMVRHPLERMESAYIEHAASTKSQAFASINEAVRQKPMIVDSSRYWEVYSAYREAFGEARVKVIWFEPFIRDTPAVFAGVCRFLGIDPTLAPPQSVPRQNRRAEAVPRMRRLGRSGFEPDLAWDEATRLEVIAAIREDNVRFLKHFGKPADYWGDLF